MTETPRSQKISTFSSPLSSPPALLVQAVRIPRWKRLRPATYPATVCSTPPGPSPRAGMAQLSVKEGNVGPETFGFLCEASPQRRESGYLPPPRLLADGPVRERHPREEGLHGVSRERRVRRQRRVRGVAQRRSVDVRVKSRRQSSVGWLLYGT